MRIHTIGLFIAAAVLVSACGVQPGSAEWCKGVMQGTIKADQAQLEANSEKCQEVLMKEVMGAIGGSNR